MAASGAKVIRGAATVSIGPWVTAKGAGSLVDMGYIGGPVTVQPKVEYHKVDVQQHLAPIHAWPTARSVEIKVPMSEADADKLRIVAMQPAANFTGTPPAITGLIDADAVEQYYQIVVVTKGTGATGVRTLSFWRCVCTGVDAIPFKKDGAQMYSATFEAMYEETGTGLDTLYKQVDA